MHDNPRERCGTGCVRLRAAAKPRGDEPRPTLIIPINPTSWALVNVHAMTHADPFAAGETDSPAEQEGFRTLGPHRADGLILHPGVDHKPKVSSVPPAAQDAALRH
jgi:hypothetical protein